MDEADKKTAEGLIIFDQNRPLFPPYALLVRLTITREDAKVKSGESEMDKLLSVTEYAQLYHKDPGNIRRHLASGRLSGQKIGNQWVIPKDAPYPNDKRQKTGKYRNWRKRISLNSNKTLMNSLRMMADELSGIYGDLLREVIIYGSYARGTQTEESDIDIALILNKKPAKSMTDKMINCVAKHELDCDKVLSVVDIQSDQFDNWKTCLPFYMNIDKEGISVWKAK